MLLTIEIAAGVLLGLLLYRGLVKYSERRNLTLPAVILFWPLMLAIAVLAVGLLGLSVFLFYYAMTNPQYLRQHFSQVLWAAALIIALCVVYALRSDITARRNAKNFAAKAVCEECGKIGLRFGHFKNSPRAEPGREYEHPTGTCPQCGHEQELTSDARF